MTGTGRRASSSTRRRVEEAPQVLGTFSSASLAAALALVLGSRKRRRCGHTQSAPDSLERIDDLN